MPDPCPHLVGTARIGDDILRDVLAERWFIEVATAVLSLAFSIMIGTMVHAAIKWGVERAELLEELHRGIRHDISEPPQRRWTCLGGIPVIIRAAPQKDQTNRLVRFTIRRRRQPVINKLLFAWRLSRIKPMVKQAPMISNLQRIQPVIILSS